MLDVYVVMPFTSKQQYGPKRRIFQKQPVTKFLPPIQRVPRALSFGVKRQEFEADHSLPSSVEVKNAEKIFPLPNMSS
jgi:hypothetical protein